MKSKRLAQPSQPLNRHKKVFPLWLAMVVGGNRRGGFKNDDVLFAQSITPAVITLSCTEQILCRRNAYTSMSADKSK